MTGDIYWITFWNGSVLPVYIRLAPELFFPGSLISHVNWGKLYLNSLSFLLDIRASRSRRTTFLEFACVCVCRGIGCRDPNLYISRAIRDQSVTRIKVAGSIKGHITHNRLHAE